MRMLIACLVVLGSAAIANADDPVAAPPAVTLPEPRPLPPIGYYRVSAYEVWQNLSVDHRGFFRARVIETPYGAFYRYNGHPFPWTSTKQYLAAPVMPYATD